MAKPLMVQGTASNVGKSIIATALCRVFTGDGYNVSPFKSQNMSLNSYITPEGDEIGRAQVIQAEACRKPPHYLMNPILLKPQQDSCSQVILNGKVFDTISAKNYYAQKPFFKQEAWKAYEQLSAGSDVVVIEGAGSPVEINLTENDFVNMGMAKMARSPVILAADIDRGGVFASVVGTLSLLKQEEKAMVKGIIINKFRGDLDILKPGLEKLEKLTGTPVLGVLPFETLYIEDEDSMACFNKWEQPKQGKDLDIAVIKLPYCSNFTDINALALEPGTSVRFVGLQEDLKKPDLIILPGTKNTIHCAQMLKSSGMGQRIRKAWENGSFVAGICGGYQLLGRRITDKVSAESDIKESQGLGLIEMDTVFGGEKTTVQSLGIETMFETKVKGYEIHMGQECFPSGLRPQPFVIFDDGRQEGVLGDRLWGSYFHGIFDNGAFTRRYLNLIRRLKGLPSYEGEVVDYGEFKEKEYNRLAALFQRSVNMKAVYDILEAGV